jgi:hypothetical protein
MTYDEEELAFYHELGQAICNWSAVEIGIYRVISAAVQADDPIALGLGFFAIDNFRAKLAFADAFLQMKLKEQAHKSAWDAFVTRLERTAKKRNRLAHDRVMVYVTGRPGRRFALERWPDLTPRRRTKSWPPTTPRDGAICLRDVVSCKRDFYFLALELRNFAATLLGQKEPHPEVRGRVESPPTIRAIARQMHEALGRQRAPSRRKP